MITAEIFKEKVGRDPEHDDLDRCNCNKAGEAGHLQCGWCEDHDKPRFDCGCYYQKSNPFVIFNETTRKFIQFEYDDYGIAFCQEVNNINDATVMPFGHRSSYYIQNLLKFDSLKNSTLVPLKVKIIVTT